MAWCRLARHRLACRPNGHVGPYMAAAASRTLQPMPHLEQRVTVLGHHRRPPRALALQLAEPQLCAHLQQAKVWGKVRHVCLEHWGRCGHAAGTACRLAGLLWATPDPCGPHHTSSPRSPMPGRHGTQLSPLAGRRCPNMRRRRRRPGPPRCPRRQTPGWPAILQTVPAPPWPRSCPRGARATRTEWAGRGRLPGALPGLQKRSEVRSGRVSMPRPPLEPCAAAHSPAACWPCMALLPALGCLARHSSPCLPPPQHPGEAQSRALSLSPRTARPANHPQPCARSSVST